MFGNLFNRPQVATRTLELEYRRVDPSNPSPFGSGGCFNAGIYVIRRRSDNRECVEKCFKPEDIRNGRAKFEMFALRELRHKNVVEYLHAFIDIRSSARASMYMEKADLGTLEALIKEFRLCREYPLPSLMWNLAMQLCNAVAYLQDGIRDASSTHSSNRQPDPEWVGIVHRDIKPANIFFSRDDGAPYPRAMLGDFGQAIREDNDNWEREYQGGDREWSPPEAPRAMYATDWWAVGACVQALGRLGSQPSSTGKGQRLVGLGSRYSDDLTEAIKEFMRHHPDDRLDVRQLAPDASLRYRACYAMEMEDMHFNEPETQHQRPGRPSHAFDDPRHHSSREQRHSHEHQQNQFGHPRHFGW